MQKLIVPEIIIQNSVDGLLQYIRNNWDSNVDKTNTILYKLWNGTSLGGYDMYDQAQAVFLRPNDDPRKLKITPSFDTEKKNVPSMHINLPSEQGGYTDSLGISQNRDDVTFDPDNTVDNYSRGFTPTYSVVIVSDNKVEVQLIYHTIRALMIPLFEHYTVECLENLKISGRDMQIYSENVPTNMFIRAINLQTSYVVTVDRLFTDTLAKNIMFNGTAIDDTITI